jgi:hypothetical protein
VEARPHAAEDPVTTMGHKTLGALTAEIREINVAKGFRPAGGGPGTNSWGDYVALLHSEISEALEAYRDHRLEDATKSARDEYLPPGQMAKPEGVGSELADAVIRLLDMCDVFEVPLDPDLELDDIQSLDIDVPGPCPTFGDLVTWLHVKVSRMAIDPMRTGAVQARALCALVTVARRYSIDLDFEVTRKITYNKTRAFQHGGRTLDGATQGPVTRNAATKSSTFFALQDAIPDDPRDWWTGGEIDAFLSTWERLELPEVTMQDGSGERLTVWCTDVRRAAEMLGMTGGLMGSTLGPDFEITKGAYTVAVVQAEEKEMKAQNDPMARTAAERKLGDIIAPSTDGEVDQLTREVLRAFPGVEFETVIKKVGDQELSLRRLVITGAWEVAPGV